MLEIVIQGRGGQGAQMAGQLLANALFREGKHVLSFATYGGARRGTPVSSFIRIDDKPIRLRCDIENANIIVCFDASLLNKELLKGATKDTCVLINSSKPRESFASIGDFKIFTIDGKEVANANGLGKIINSALVGAFAGLLPQMDINVLAQVVKDMSPRKAEQNVKCCLDGYRLIKQQEGLIS